MTDCLMDCNIARDIPSLCRSTPCCNALPLPLTLPLPMLQYSASYKHKCALLRLSASLYNL